MDREKQVLRKERKMKNNILEKVIEGFTTCVISGTRKDCIGCGCPYFIYNEKCLNHLFHDAVELLRTQKPVEPNKVNRYIDFDGEGQPYTPDTYDCGFCGNELPLVANYCPKCGKAVKWVRQKEDVVNNKIEGE